ncbi:hypothetical protein B0F90DRAFT_1680537 [Multifurca ochricompacta]|uniref:O-fucosyltransferase family protein n=1 Tax=Multifurca ochricompacta TaxID=376703 RepID=A0AAD4MD39_9AGAM|nr:hypothetical protein B0F90DRAFT_1680537 [Multifurca ochricompacta]
MRTDNKHPHSHALNIDDDFQTSTSTSLLGFHLDSPRFIPHRFSSRRRRLIITAASLISVLSLFLLAYLSLSNPSSRTPSIVSEDRNPQLVPTITWNRKSSLLGPPTDRFRDNLRNDTKYITSWISAGWTNDVMTYGNLIYLAMLTERIPIIGPFTPSHIGGDAGNIAFGEVFDVDYLSKAIGIPVLEWSEVKNTSSQEIEDIGCWSVWQAVQTRESDPRLTNALPLQGLDISFTAGPTWLQKIPGYEHDPHAHFWSIASLLYSPERENNLIEPQPSKVHGAVLSPDEHLACFDYLYYVCGHTSFEYERDISPAWRFVAKHFRWTNRLQTISDGYLRRIFNVPNHDPIPPYIAIHARRANDFIVYCRDVPKEDCFPSIPTYQRRIAEIQDETRERLGIVPQHIIMLSDEEDPAWWDSIRMVGWYTIDHVAEDTVNKYGRWYPVLIDAVIQSSGIGIIGMQQSTMSLLAGRRVQDWHNGVFKSVKWGTPHADDH